jgi:hypothetical protein
MFWCRRRPCQRRQGLQVILDASCTSRSSRGCRQQLRWTTPPPEQTQGTTIGGHQRHHTTTGTTWPGKKWNQSMHSNADPSQAVQGAYFQARDAVGESGLLQVKTATGLVEAVSSWRREQEQTSYFRSWLFSSLPENHKHKDKPQMFSIGNYNFNS